VFAFTRLAAATGEAVASNARAKISSSPVCAPKFCHETRKVPLDAAATDGAC
jgi:hypothetical protein